MHEPALSLLILNRAEGCRFKSTLLKEVMSIISILIIDDHRIVFEGTRGLFHGMQDMCIETVSSPKQVLAKMQQVHFDVF